MEVKQAIPLVCSKGHEWDYTGKKKTGSYTNCPECMIKVKIQPHVQSSNELYEKEKVSVNGS